MKDWRLWVGWMLALPLLLVAYVASIGPALTRMPNGWLQWFYYPVIYAFERWDWFAQLLYDYLQWWG